MVTKNRLISALKFGAKPPQNVNPGVPPRRRGWVFHSPWLMLLIVGSAAAADIKVMIAVDPSDREAMVISVLDIRATLSRVVGQPVDAIKSQDLGDVMRTTRTGGYDIYIAPAHVAASALAHGYTLVGSTEDDEIYQFLGRAGSRVPADVQGGKIYLTQQDSMGAYIARGMLNEAGQSLKMFQEILYRSTSGAGLFAMDVGLVDSTVAKKSDVLSWLEKTNSKSKVLLTSRPVPGGMSVVVKKTIGEGTRARLESWFRSANGSIPGIGRVRYASDLANYRYVSALGNWTPSELPGVTRVDAATVVALQQKSVRVVDVRTVKEYNERRIRGAMSAPYGEKSLKDVAFDDSKDDWPAAEKLNKDQPVIFHCNGAECWKSYKAAKVAVARGFKRVYWFRGGLPEWESNGLPTESSPTQAAALNR